MKTVEIFCDGACSGNGKEINAGGWGAVLIFQDISKEIYGGAPQTTNNIMELTAVIEGLKSLKSKDLIVTIYSDSAYVVNCFQQGWYHKWLLNGWKNSKKEPVENKLLWQELIHLVESFYSLNFYKVKGHLDLDKPSQVKKWYENFNKTNQLNISLDEYLRISKLNHLADQLANTGMAPYKIS